MFQTNDFFNNNLDNKDELGGNFNLNYELFNNNENYFFDYFCVNNSINLYFEEQSKLINKANKSSTFKSVEKIYYLEGKEKIVN